MHTDSIVSPFFEQASSYLKDKKVREIIFSKGTYHVCLEDTHSKDPAWAFIQIDNHQNVRDFFCSCQSESGQTCEHLAAAILAIYRGHDLPLHKRFEHSFWFKITQAFALEYGYDTDLLTQNEGQYSLKKRGETLFFLKPKTSIAKKYFQETINERKKETEETSLKFSNLPKKELILWREGRPSHAFRYELSFWSDLAKFLMLLSENESPCEIQFTFDAHLPRSIVIEFEALQCSFSLSKTILIEIIPFLSTIKTPLEVQHTPSVTIDKILYCPQKKSLLIHPKKDKTNKPSNLKGEKLGDWIYLHKKGFYHQTKEPLTETRHILSHSIDKELEANTAFFHKHLQETPLDPEPKKPKYLIQFDPSWNLEIFLYLFDPSDFKSQKSSFFGKWVYIENRGFFRLQETVFHQPSLFIPKDKVTEFIRQYRYWLNSQKGFEIHLAPLETQISYQLNQHHQLIFSSRIAYQKEHYFDFGEWIYIKDQGFYSKPRNSSPIRNGLMLQKEEISKFIHLNQEDLESIAGFFSPKSPLKKVTLNLKADIESQSIVIEPCYEFYPEYQHKKVLFLGLYSYVEKEGFHKLSKNLQLPKGFRKKVKVPPQDQTSFLAFQLQSLKPFISSIEPALEVPKDLQLSLSSFQNNHYQIDYKSLHGKASIFKLYEAMKEGHPYLISPAGLLQLNHPRFSWINDLQKEQFKEEGLALTSLDLIRIEALDSLFTHQEDQLSLLEQVKGLTQFEKPSLKGFKTKLRPYQQTGLTWLWKLYLYDLSGILCDDMGLGKTLQAMALMAAIKNQAIKRPYPGYKAKKKKFLIVCPTSVIYHWQDKLQQFYPKLNILTFYGLSRSLKRFQQQFDILLTSYGILRIDHKILSQYEFHLAIYDELQVAKNHRSLTYSALQKIPAKMKLGLTGTPIENNLRELKALFDLIVPTYFPSEERFKNLFINPIERDRDENQSKLLKKLITPFILRRKKEDVVTDLPDKTEEVSRCELSKDQARLYQEVLELAREPLLKDLKDEQKHVPYVHIFALLNKLKQICNHPKSVDPIQYAHMESGKWELFLQLLEEARESRQKVVVFTQYLAMMDLMEEYMKTHRIGYASIRGATKDRRTPLKRFQNDPDCEVFIGSLKAVGLGIDLTAASIVIHYDRWWNAAREQQATDRVHRIGQQKGVLVFKLVTLNTLEEKIDRIIAKKERLMEEVVGTSDEDQIKTFSREDLIDLLQFVHKDVYTSS